MLHDAAAIMVAARERAFLAEDDLQLLELRLGAIVEPRARHRGAAAAVGGIGEAEIDRPVLRVIAVEDDVEQSALSAREDRRQAFDCGRQFSVARDDAQPSRPFGDQHAAVGQEGERPGVDEPARDGLDIEIAGGGAEHLALRQGRRGHGRGKAGGGELHGGELRRQALTVRRVARFRKALSFRDASPHVGSRRLAGSHC